MLDFYYDTYIHNNQTVVNYYEWAYFLKVLCNAAVCVFQDFLLKLALSNVLDPDTEMKGKSGADA